MEFSEICPHPHAKDVSELYPLVSAVADIMAKRDYYTLDHMLHYMDLAPYNPLVLISFARTLMPAQSSGKLLFWELYVRRVKEHLEILGEDVSVMRGLI